MDPAAYSDAPRYVMTTIIIIGIVSSQGHLAERPGDTERGQDGSGHHGQRTPLPNETLSQPGSGTENEQAEQRLTNNCVHIKIITYATTDYTTTSQLGRDRGKFVVTRSLSTFVTQNTQHHTDEHKHAHDDRQQNGKHQHQVVEGIALFTDPDGIEHGCPRDGCRTRRLDLRRDVARLGGRLRGNFHGGRGRLSVRTEERRARRRDPRGRQDGRRFRGRL